MSHAITARTALCGILLHPAGHTLSPALHNAAYGALELDAVFVAFDVAPPGLAAALQGARALPIRQLALSIPHKEAALVHLDVVEPTARAIGAVNTVTWRDGGLWGSNTDWTGAVGALEREISLEGRRAVVLGAGGAARATVYGLLERGARVTVLNRSVERAQTLVRSLGAEAAGPLQALGELPWEVLVNATSVGLRSDVSPVPASVLRRGTVVMDAVYDPEWTRLLRDARDRGARVVPGRWMLIYQAREQIRLWSGLEPPLAVLASAFERAARASGAAPYST